MSRILRVNDPDGEPIGTVLSIVSLERLLEGLPPGRYHVDEISQDLLPSGRYNSRRWGIAIIRGDSPVKSSGDRRQRLATTGPRGHSGTDPANGARRTLRCSAGQGDGAWHWHRCSSLPNPASRGGLSPIGPASAFFLPRDVSRFAVRTPCDPRAIASQGTFRIGRLPHRVLRLDDFRMESISERRAGVYAPAPVRRFFMRPAFQILSPTTLAAASTAIPASLHARSNDGSTPAAVSRASPGPRQADLSYNVATVS